MQTAKKKREKRDISRILKGLPTRINLIVATQHNAAPIYLSVKKAAWGSNGFIRS